MAGNLDNIDASSSLVTMTTVGKNTVLSLKESLTFENCEAFETLVNAIVEQNPSGVVLDCKAVAFLDSKALELLLQTHEEIKRRSGLLKFANLNAVCKDIFIVTRLINIFHVYEDIPEAVRSRL